MTLARILVVDGSVTEGAALCAALRDAGHEAIATVDATGAVSAVRAAAVDAIVTDWQLADGTALHLAGALQALGSSLGVPIVVAASHSHPGDAALALDGGIDDYFVRSSSAPEELIARVNAALRRPPGVNGQRRQVGVIALDRVSHRIMVRGADLDLAPAEFRLMAYFIEHPGRVFTRRQLLAQVWNRRKGIGERTVDVHVRRLRAVLAPHGCDELLQTVRGFGYRFG
jgi:two-component system phosphate regulon response regulator PhoB